MMDFKRILSVLVIGCLSLAWADGEVTCSPVTCFMACPYGFSKDVNGCELCQCQTEMCQAVTCGKGKLCKEFTLSSAGNTTIARCVDPKTPVECQQPMDVGTCRGMFVKWFYDSDTGACQEFNYGGCTGNDNKFDTMLSCDTKCNPDKFGSCSPIMCAMYCENGFKKDEKGCDTCACNPPSEVDPPQNIPKEKTFDVKLGCEEIDELECDLHCPHGYVKDYSGCNTCECTYPATCSQVRCANECPNGRHVNSTGCPTCECRTPGECSPIQCRMFCQFGYKKDKNGCDHCQCADSPCTTTVCPAETYCELVDSKPSCLMQSSWSTDCDTLSCMMACEHGFKSDTKGCPVCECLTEPKPVCAGGGARCKRICEYGFQKDQFGCEVCKCLPNPCQDKKCEETQVCEIVSECLGSHCKHTGKCSETEAIRRVRVHLNYAHEQPLEEKSWEQFTEKVKERFMNMLNIEDAQIKDIQVNPETDFVRIALEVVNEGKNNLVDAWRSAETHILNKAEESSITYNGQSFVPQHDSLVSVYSSSTGEDNSPSAPQNTTLIIIIACAVGGAVVLVVAGLVAASKSKKKDKKRSNVIYKKAPEDQPMV